MKNITLIFGEEEFLVNRQLKRIIKDTIGTDDKTAYSTYDSLETPISQVIEDCETIPFFEEKKVVVCKNPLFFTASRAKTSFEHDINHLEQYLNNPVDYTHLVFVLNEQKLDSRKKIVKLLKKEANVFESNMMAESEIVDTIIKIFKKNDLEISRANANLIVSKVGNRFGVVYKEISKLITYLGDDPVTKESIDLLISRTLEEDIFTLVDMILQKNKVKAHQIYKDLLELKEDPIKIMILVANQIRLIYQSKILYKKGLAEKDIAKKLSVHPYRVKLAFKKSKDFTGETLLHFLDQLTELDYKIKTGKINKVTGLELFIMSI